MSVWNWIEDKTGAAWGEFEAKTGFAPPPLHSYIVQVSDGIWRCSWPDDAMLFYLARQGCMYVVNLCAEKRDDEAVIKQSMTPINLPEVDATAIHLETVEETIKYTKQGKTAVHCRAGHGRTGQDIAGIRVLEQDWTPTAALIEAQSYGHLEPDQVRFILNLKGGGAS